MTKDSNTSNLINFKDTFQLLKNYLSKKRFNYVYEEAMKYYSKNNALLSNHEVLQLCNIIFFVLQKRFKSKIIQKMVEFNILTVKEIHKTMINIYIGWQQLITIQLTAEDPHFFNMLHRKGKNQSHMQKLQIKKLLLQPKFDSIITQKVKSQFQLYSFLKQTLRMTINNLITFSMNQSYKLQELASIIIKGQNIMAKFEDVYFFIQKTQFQIVKFQILECLSSEQKTKIVKFGVSLEYRFPLGLLSQIYKKIQIWDDTKLDHYIKLLCKYSLMVMKNCIMTFTDIYILACQLKRLIEAIKNKNIVQNIPRSGRVQKDLKFQFNVDFLTDKSQKTNQKQKKESQKVKKIRSKDSFSAKKVFKKKLQAIYKSIIEVIQQYVFAQKQVQHVIKYYMIDIYSKYSNLASTDEIVAQPIILIQKQNTKSKKIVDKVQSLASRMAVPNKKRHILSLLKKQSIVNQQNQQNKQTSSHNNKKFGKQFILKNINLIKKQKKLELGKPQNRKSNGKISSIIVQQKITKKLFDSLPSLNLETNLQFNQQSDSDSDREMTFQFQQKRRTAILALNNKIYKNKNSNYIINKKQRRTSDLQFQNQDLENSNDQNKSVNQDNNQKQFAFQQIKLLDEVVRDQISNYLNIEIKSDKNSTTNSHANTKKPSKHTTNNTGIIEIKQVTKNMQRLKEQVDEMNKEHLLVIDKFTYQKNLLKTEQKYNSNSTQEEEIYHSGAFKQIDNIVNFKYNLTEKAEKCIEMYRNLMNLQKDENRKGIFDKIISKYGSISKLRNRISQNQSQNHIQNQQNAEQIKIVQYLVEHRPMEEWQIDQNKKDYLKKFGSEEGSKQDEIALRQTFDLLRRNISKTQFDQNHVSNKIANVNLQF